MFQKPKEQPEPSVKKPDRKVASVFGDDSDVSDFLYAKRHLVFFSSQKYNNERG